jgi:hypothetical protein
MAVVLVVLTLLTAPLVLAQQQDGGVDTGYAEPIETPVPVVDSPNDGSGNAEVGFLQYNPQPPSGAYYDCPPLTEPRMLRPCILRTS